MIRRNEHLFAAVSVLKTTRRLLKVEAAKRELHIWQLLEQIMLDISAPLDKADKTDRSRAARAR